MTYQEEFRYTKGGAKVESTRFFKREIWRAFSTLDDNEFTFDYILSHCAANSIQKGLSRFFIKKDKLTCFFESILDDLRYKHWYFGHYHMNKTVNKYKATCIYKQLIKLN